MDQSIQTDQQELDQAIPPVSEHVNADTRISSKYIVLGLIVLILVVVGAFMLGRRTNNGMIVKESDPSPSVTATVSMSPVPLDQNGMQTFTSKVIPEIHENRASGWRPFVLHYPSSWSIVEDEYSEGSPGPTLTLKMSKKDGSYFELLQGFGEGARCLYTNDPDINSYDGMGSVYTTYDEIVKGDQKWRLSAYKVPDELWTHQLCGLSKNGWFLSSYNSLGIHKIKLVGDESYREFLEILKQVEIK